ncbi:UDP-3-O-(3-hydroxymyristoyl)glucosamine N-acyltransferase [Anatilimnocola floriformis]|uniref:UDP-3-O-(3-hydroxymyristoyl)glucosamine N-acyltransferase n=1 Tax=Anatilimnocola floriformis TaxID=2948575 RepID=UPI0020C41391|nr:UDP-3-O-(3-hydroxymyristoyl)glucosamine N-acyltransferase [Anatilimnocola floriformis]
MNLTLSAIAALVQGELHGDGSQAMTGAATLATAKPGEITLADNVKLARQLAASAASAVIVPRGFAPEGRPFIVVDNVHAAFAKVVQQFRPQRPKRAVGVSPSASISASAQLSAGVEIHPLAFIGDDVEIGEGAVIHSGVRILEGCKIGAGTTIFPNAVLYDNTIIGQRCLIHAGAVLGSYGFGYSSSTGKHVLCSQLGWVEIGNDVEIGSCTTIDRGTYGPTTIGDGTKLDNQVQIAHNCRVGQHNIICSQTGMAGSSSTGDYVVIAGQAGLRDHVHIGDHSVIGAKSGVMGDVEPKSRVVGIPATEERFQYSCVVAVHKLPDLRHQIVKMQKQLDALQAQALASTQACGDSREAA